MQISTFREPGGGGIVPVSGGKPTRILEESFGVEGDIPVLGDVDGF